MNNNYCIKEGYQHKTIAPTALAEGLQYWTSNRLASSKYYQYYVYKYAKDLIKKNKFSSCVDVGCGSGYKLAHIIAPHCKRTVGIDQPFIIERCKKVYPYVEWQSEDFDNPTKTTLGTFDVVLCADVIEHLLNPDILISYIKSRVKKNSVILISTPERDVMNGLDNNAAVNKEHIREWNAKEFKQYLETQGLVVDEILLQPSLRPHFHRRYFSYIKHNWNKMNYCMLAVCRLA
jgi:2-polyprenyl-3-methyl-5-hydroxy-6-metoxy-1,4-benzoquinol methylase